ncbi:MAG: tRNA (adenosine(37)-N6)-dimethylallyltransferase MiaA [Coriobacteriales bacterium]
MPLVICIQGPTASGKSELAERLALEFDGEVVSADSMQIYRGMDIGTAKMPVDERRVPYHCLDILEPGQPYSAALFQRDARRAFADMARRGRAPVLCGGTGFYVRAALDDLQFAPGEQQDNPLRQRLAQLLANEGEQALYELLQREDPESAQLVHPHDVKRVMRALEMHEAGESYAQRKQAFRSVSPLIPNVKIALSVDRELLYEKINRRVELIVANGLVDEVKGLLAQGFRTGLTAPQAIGYKEIVAYLDGETSLDEAIELIKRSSRRYAKRQMTWLRSERAVHWISCDTGITHQVFETAADIVREATGD